MTNIRILPEILSNKIAAGEVVERPASVVKELVENALDAGATRIIIDIEKGGRSLIRISDNGSGMSPDDALLSIERYATSKIYTQEDLFSIKTLGFRGEALPSIASVSRFTMVTRDASSDAGTEVQIEGGKIKNVSQAGAPKGTMIAVKQLFFNTPARRKFLKSVHTEMGHIADVVSSMALGHPAVQFKLFHNGRVVKNWVRAADPRERVMDVLGKDLKANLVRVQHDNEVLELDGWIGAPEITRATSRSLYISINGRIVKDRVVQHALYEGYAGRIMKGRFPLAALFLQVPHDTLDVNVHPTKSEVRFVHQKGVHDSLRLTVSKALRRFDEVKWGRDMTLSNGTAPGIAESRPGFHATGDKARSGRTRLVVKTGRSAFSEEAAWQPEAEAPSEVPLPAERRSDFPLSGQQDLPAASKQPELWRKTRFADLKVVGQFQDVYVVCEAGEDMVMIDQHAAHERIVYEHLKKRKDVTVESQGLLMPETFDLGYREARAIKKIMPDLERLGFKIEHFGGDSFVVQSVPSLLKTSDARPLVVEIVEKWIESGAGTVSEEVLDDMLKIMACHSSVRANQRLTDLEVKTLLRQMDACDNPSHCPHGRPTWVKLDRRTIEKMFKRVV